MQLLRVKKLFISSIFLLSTSACVTNPATGRRSFIAISQEQEKEMGEEAYKEVLTKEQISRDPKLNAVLLRVGKRIASVVPSADFDWQFTLIQSKEMNAFCLPGGKVAFYTGIVPVLQNEAGMAIVMGHEVAHAVARHGAQRVSESLVIAGGLTVFDKLIFNQDSKYRTLIMSALGIGVQGAVALPHSRRHETEADELGLRYAAQAGYDPAEAVRFWERFSQATGAGKPPEFMSTHPADTTRIANLQKLQAEAQGLYQRSARYGLGEKL